MRRSRRRCHRFAVESARDLFVLRFCLFAVFVDNIHTHTHTYKCIITSRAKKERAHTHTQRITTCITNSFGYFVRCTLCFHRTDAYYALFPPFLFQRPHCLLACALSPQTACTACNCSALARTHSLSSILPLFLEHFVVACR